MSRKPNVIVFFTDQQRWDTTGVHHNPMGLTPNFDRMASEGTHLFNTFTCQPVCLPARACLQTGLFATQVGCNTNRDGLSSTHKTLAHHFNGAGYHTGYIGKWHLCKDEIVTEKDRGGYQYWLAARATENVSDAYDCVLYDNENQKVNLPGYRVDAHADAAIRFIDQNREKPFFLFCSFLEPHFQNSRDDYPAPTGYEDLYNDPWMPPDLRTLQGTAARHLPGYYGMVKRLDEALGRVLDSLRSLGLEDDTIVLFTSDHGCHFRTRNDEYKRSCHDASIRVPGAITGPGFVGGGRVQELVSLVDFAPTLLDACGIEVPNGLSGRSVVPLTKGMTEGWPEEVFVQISESQIGRAVRTKRWKYSVSVPGADPWNDAGSDTYLEDSLFDLKADPYELNNLIGEKTHKAIAEKMRAILMRRMEAAGEKIPVIELRPETDKANYDDLVNPDIRKNDPNLARE